MEKWQADTKRLREHLSNQQVRFQRFGESFERARTRGRRIFISGEGSLEDMALILAQDYFNAWPVIPFSLEEADLSETEVRPTKSKVEVPDDLKSLVGGYAKYLQAGDVLFILAHNGKSKRLRALLKLAELLEVKRYVIGGIEARSKIKSYSSIFMTLPTRGIKTICEAVFPCARIIARYARSYSPKASDQERSDASGIDQTTWAQLKQVSAEITKQAQEKVRQSGQHTRPASTRKAAAKSTRNQKKQSRRSKTQEHSQRNRANKQSARKAVAPEETNLLRAIEESSDSLPTAEPVKAAKSSKTKKRSADSQRKSANSQRRKTKQSARKKSVRGKQLKSSQSDADAIAKTSRTGDSESSTGKSESQNSKEAKSTRTAKTSEKKSAEKAKGKSKRRDSQSTRTKRPKTAPAKTKNREQRDNHEVEDAVVTVAAETKNVEADKARSDKAKTDKSDDATTKKNRKSSANLKKKTRAEAKKEADSLLRSSGIFGDLDLTSDEFMPRYIRDALDPDFSVESGVFFGDESVDGPFVRKNFGLDQCKLQVSRKNRFNAESKNRRLQHFDQTGLSFLVDQEDSLLENLGFRAELHCRMEIPAFLEPLEVRGRVVGLEAHEDEDNFCVTLKFVKLADAHAWKVERAAAALSKP